MTDTATISSARPSDEMLPFLNNFHDIFTTIGVVILLGGLGAGAGQILGGLEFAEGEMPWQASLMGLIAGFALASWLLSALLVGRQRRILPGIVLSGAFTVAMGVVLTWGYTQLLVHGFGINEASLELAFENSEGDEFTRDAVMSFANELPWVVRLLPVAAVLAFLIPAYSYYRNFRLPFAGGLVGLGAIALFSVLALIVDPYTTIVYAPTVNLLAGAALLLAGIVFDMRDPERTTRLSGTGFWLHFFAAPILLGAVLNVTQIGWSLQEADFTQMEDNNLFAALAADNGNAMALAATALIVIGVFALVSLLINRRALIVSGILTAGISIGVLVNETGLGGGAVAAITLLVLGGIVVLLGAAWNPVRSILLAPFPSSGPIARLFPPADLSEG
ncbi:MAG: hypothetical protein GYB36_11370 [Alphaproteobacteria bacterium]|nr:hypothetical protein [Alphaproteobacteria bacterium]